jgi:hypothetical protein
MNSRHRNKTEEEQQQNYLWKYRYEALRKNLTSTLLTEHKNVFITEAHFLHQFLYAKKSIGTGFMDLTQ